METIEVLKGKNVSTNHEEEARDDEKFQELVQSLPMAKDISGDLCFYQGFWCPIFTIKGVVSFQKHFQALDSDVIVATIPKSGTTWLKALTFSIVNRHKYSFKDNPLLGFNPHQLVRILETDLYLNKPRPNFENYTDHPRVFSTHIPFSSLPTSIKDSKTKIVYLCRNPMDVFVSYWHFFDRLLHPNMEIEEVFETFIQGMFSFGPFCDHALGYWKANQENPNKVLFFKYEDIKENTFSNIKKLANFLGFSFSEEEEKRGVIEEIVKLCSFDNLKEVEVNKSGSFINIIPNSIFFRKGKVGDWSNYLTPSMIKRLEKLVQEKLDKSGLMFNI